jgi:hypothetical protein
MEKEPLDQTPANAADTATASREPPLDAQPSSLENATQDGREGGKDASANNAPDNTERRDMERGENTVLSRTEEDTYISGWRLVLVWVPLSLVAFLMLLDISIVATVSFRLSLPLHGPACYSS